MTVDPQRDTPAVLDAYARGFDARILALGGSEALVRRAADAFRVSYEQVREPGAAADAYTIDHTVGLFLLGPDGQLLERIAYGTPAREIAARVEAWMSAAAAR
jgi:protein SCO1/2